MPPAGVCIYRLLNINNALPTGGTQPKQQKGKHGTERAQRRQAESVGLHAASLLMCVKPTPSAGINGTVIEPVVTLPEPNAIPRKSASVNAARKNGTVEGKQKIPQPFTRKNTKHADCQKQTDARADSNQKQSGIDMRHEFGKHLQIRLRRRDGNPGHKAYIQNQKQIFDFSQRRSDFCVDGRHENFRTQGKKPHSENQKTVANKKLKTNPSAKAGMLRDKSITIATIGSTLRAAPAIFSKVKAAVSRYTSSFTLFHLFCFIMP